VARYDGHVIIKPPLRPSIPEDAKIVFLAGSIEMGVAEMWQDKLASELNDRTIVIANPRRDDWDASWKQTIADAQFRGQVEWELDYLDRAAVIAMWFDPSTKSPITLMELGLHARGGKVIVGCPQGFWRRGNIEVVCARYGVPLHATWEAFVANVRAVV
jgi:hypothetical protein